MDAMTKQMKAAGSAIALAAVLMSNAAFGATALGHVSVTILPTTAGVMESSPIELAGLSVTKAGGPAHSTGHGVVTVTGAPNEAITISVSSSDPITGPGPAMSLGSFTHNAGKSPALSGAGSLTFAVGTTVAMGASQPSGAYAGSYTVTVNY
jgi:Domain of unknown function (DUF4402)